MIDLCRSCPANSQSVSFELESIGQYWEIRPAGNKKPRPTRLGELQKWSDDRGGRTSTADCCFAGISPAAMDWRSRTHCWHLQLFLVASYQLIILMLCVFSLFMRYGIPQLLFDCTARLAASIPYGRWRRTLTIPQRNINLSPRQCHFI